MGRGHAIGSEQLAALRAVVEDNRAATLEDLCKRWAERSGVRVCTLTMRQALRRAGLKREQVKPSEPSTQGNAP